MPNALQPRREWRECREEREREREREIKNRYLIITRAASIYYNYQAVSIEQQRREAFIGEDRRR